MQFKRRDEVSTIEEEREGLRAQHAALEELKRQLAERVDAVRERELELHHALAEAGGTRGPARSTSQASVIAGAGADTGGALDADRRERALSERERALDAREELIAKQERELRARADQTAPAPPPRSDDAKLAAIEARLVELRNAEKLFLRTRDELASRSEAVAARERLVAQKERELDDLEDAKGPWAPPPALSEMEARLRRLEQQQQPGEQTLGFSSGLRRLEQGTRTQRGS